jgi:hypothetical protein
MKKNKAVKILVQEARNGTPLPFVNIFFGLKPKALKNLLTNTPNGVLKLLVNDKTFEDLAHVLDELDPDNLKAVFQTKSDDKSIYAHIKTIRYGLDEERGYDQHCSLKTKLTEMLQEGRFGD